MDPYTYPASNVLRNRRNIQELEALDAFESNASTRRLIELRVKPLPVRFDVAHLKAIHQYLFRDVYPWAGQFRTVNISKGGHLFGFSQFIEMALADILAKLPAEQYLKGSDRPLFAARAGYYLGEINAIHPFREGNGRTQREFIRTLAVAAAFQIDWGKTTRDDMTEASIHSFTTGDNSGFVSLLTACLE